MNTLSQVLSFPPAGHPRLLGNACIMVSPAGKGFLNQLSCSNSQVQPLICRSTLIPSPEEAIDQFHTAGGQLTFFNPLGADTLEGQFSLMSETERRLETGV